LVTNGKCEAVWTAAASAPLSDGLAVGKMEMDENEDQRIRREWLPNGNMFTSGAQ
jgi:hypothetical protein